ncbi:vanadium-dependent haloperoxidase [Archangium violaceum]|uniref:Haloperoxidase n=1 Tax=Archangium violaceum Cb vi76 TaxID=1406225 RepID=A0A084SEX9_9BACT|nr:vanadium-dependent haloperoxidase [Archangium violaceum]KFA87014.1 haloperoxidase [Archangium violaceum Cb vi76]
MHSLRVLFTGVLLLLLVGRPASAEVPAASASTPSAAYQWLDISLEATAREVDLRGARPTVLSRTLAIVLTAMYDAWAAYDTRAVGTRLGGSLRRPRAEHTLANKEKAIAYAAYRALLSVYPDEQAYYAAQMRQRGYDPDDMSTNPSTPQGVGNLAAAAVLAYRRHDGSNQFGDEPGSDGTPYSDYTGYTPVNPPDRIIDPNRWQPISFDDGNGGTVTPGFLTPHWYRVTPFALASSSQFRPPPPPLVGSPQLRREVKQVMDFNATLTPEEKALVEFMRDGPRSTGQSGHWLSFAQDVSRRDRYGLDQDVKLFFSVANVAMDAFIAAWESKRFYDSSRPWTLVRYDEAGKKVWGWVGPGQGVDRIPAEQWHPYSPSTFITPPFPGYVSGHSAVSAASGRMLELFTGRDTFGKVAHLRAGDFTEPGFPCNIIQQRKGKPSNDTEEDCQVTLSLPTFSATAEMAGISRLMGGYHIQADNEMGLEMGRRVANFVWPRIQAYFNGTVRVSEAP